MGSVASIPTASAPATTAPTAPPPVTNILNAPFTAEPEPDTTTNIPHGSRRKLNSDNEWIEEPDVDSAASDVYQDYKTFMEPGATVQIVTFHMADNVERKKRAVWAKPLKTPQDKTSQDETLQDKTSRDKTLEAVKAALMEPQDVNTWRWIHVEGLHGATMKTVAEGSGWALPTFARIFSWSRPSAEWVEGTLLVHFVDELTPIWILYNERSSNPVFITCTSLNPDLALKKRWEDFVDYGDSRPNLLIRKDPSLMLYAIVRAIAQDLRVTAYEKHEDMYAAYDLALSQPSMRSLRYFYELQQRLIRTKLNTISLRDAVKSLNIFVDKMHQELGVREKIPLVSENTRYMLRDQMGLIALLVDELPELTVEAQAVASLAFNSLSFSINNLLRWLAVLTIAAVPFSIVSGALGLNWKDRETLDGKTIGAIFGSVAFAVFLVLAVFFTCSYTKLWQPRYRADINQRNSDLEGWSATRKASETRSQRFASLLDHNEQARRRATAPRLFTREPDRYRSMAQATRNHNSRLDSTPPVVP